MLGYFGKTERTARRAYLSSMKARLTKKRPDLTGGGLVRSYGSWEDVQKAASMERIKGDERILGDSAFVERVLSGEPRRISNPSVSLDVLASRVADLFGIAAEDLAGGSRRFHLVEARSVFCFWAVRHEGYPAARVAVFLNMTPPAVGYAVERGENIVHGKGYKL